MNTDEHGMTMDERIGVGCERGDGQGRLQAYWARQMADATFRAVYEEEAAKKELWLQLDEIATEYDLTLADIYAALVYYFDHRIEIDQELAAGEAFAAALRARTPSKLPRIADGPGD